VATQPRLQVIERIEEFHDIIARLDPATARATTASPTALFPPPARALGVKSAENGPARTDSARSTY
jgi:hypothetical protein